MENNSPLSTLNSQQQNRKTILLVEDNEKIMAGNIWMFRRAGYEAIAALTLIEAHASINERKPDAIVLDIMLPDGSGLDFMRELRESENAGIPVLLLTGLGAKEDVIRGLTAGGDDYLTKPYNFPELLARVEALLRRAARVPETIACGPLKLDIAAAAAFLDGTDMMLTQKEFALLLLFTQNEGKTMSMEYLYEKAWGRPMAEDTSSVRTVVSRLRKKLSASGYSITINQGEGYCLRK